MAEMDYKERARKREKERKQSVWYKLAEGDNTFRLLPTPPGKNNQPVWVEYAIHRDVGPKKVQVRCGKSPEGEDDCWLCDRKIPALVKAGRDSRATAIEAKDVFMVQVAKVDEDGNFAGPYLMTPSKTLGDSVLRLIGSKKRQYEHPTKGFNLTVSRTGTGKNDTRYGSIEVDEAPSSVPSEIVKKLKPFEDLKEIPKYSEGAQKAAYQGIDYVEKEEEEEEEEEAPARRKKPASRRRAEPEEEPEEDVEPEDEEDVEVDEDEVDELGEEDVEEEPEPVRRKPAKPATKPAPKPVAKAKPKPEEDEEEGEEEAPPPRRKPAPVTKPVKRKAEPEDELDGDLSELDELGEDEEGEEEEGSEEEELPPPPRKKPGSAKTPPPVKKRR